MTDLLKAEFYKLRHSRAFWGLLFFSLVLGNLLLLDNEKPLSAEDCFHSSLYNTPLLSFLIIILGALFIGEDFDGRTLNAYILGGHTRFEILLAKAVPYFTACIAVLGTPLLSDGLLGLLLFGIPSQVSISSVFAESLVIFMAILAMGSLPFLCAFLFKDIGKTLAVPLALFFLMIFLLNSDTARILAHYLPMGQVRLLSMGLSKLPISCLFLTDLVWTGVCITVAGLVFRRTDMK